MSELNYYEEGLALRIEELEAQLRKSALQELSALGQASDAYQAQLAAEAKLARAVETLEFYAYVDDDQGVIARRTLAAVSETHKLKGETDE